MKNCWENASALHDYNIQDGINVRGKMQREE